MSNSKVWMPFFVADYLADTGHLGTIEHGAYLLLILHYWRSGLPLPSDDGQLRRIARMTPDEWEYSRGVLLDFFERDGNIFRHKRIEKELSDASERIAAKSRGGIAAAAKRWHSDASAIAENKQSDAPSPSPSPSQAQPQSQSQKRARARATPSAKSKIPDEFPFPSNLASAEAFWIKRGWGELCERTAEIAEGFRDHCAVHGTASLDWSASWRTWYRNALKFERKGHGPGPAKQSGRGIRDGAEHALATIRRDAGEDAATAPNGSAPRAPRALSSPSSSSQSRAESDPGTDHPPTDRPRRDIPKLSHDDRGTEPEIPDVLHGPSRANGTTIAQGLQTVSDRSSEQVLSDAGPIAGVRMRAN